MEKLVLNEKLLTVLEAIKAKQKLAIIESGMSGFPSDYPKVVRDYFYSFPKELMSELGLKRNENCIRAIELFTIPAEWLDTELDKLDRFSFSY